MTKTHAIFLSQITTNFFGLSVKFKIRQLNIGKADHSTLKTQNSTLRFAHNFLYLLAIFIINNFYKFTTQQQYISLLFGCL